MHVELFFKATLTNTIQSTLNIDLLAARSQNKARKFALVQLTHPQLLADYTKILQNKAPNAKHKTIFDKFLTFSYKLPMICLAHLQPFLFLLYVIFLLI